MKHTILIGFKNAGKTVIGKGLAESLGRKFLDLDKEIEEKKGMSVREIVKTEGESAFRKLESEVLRELLGGKDAAVLALGGGAAMAKENQEMLKGHTVILISAPKEVLFERIMRGGRPAFFKEGESDRDAFERIYKEREPVYEKLATVKVENSGTVEDAIKLILKNLNS